MYQKGSFLRQYCPTEIRLTPNRNSGIETLLYCLIIVHSIDNLCDYQLYLCRLSHLLGEYNRRTRSGGCHELPIVFCLCSLPAAVSHNCFPYPRTIPQSHPAARSPLFLRDRFDTDLFTGGAVYTYPINVPKGTNNLTPVVSLNYNSLGARDFNTYAGMGWQLTRDYIERETFQFTND